jgi:hypothetical protein
VVPELTSSMVDETAWGILNRQGSWGITVASIEKKIIFDIQVYPYWLIWQTKHSKLAAKDYEPSEFQQGMWNRYDRLGFVLVHIPWNKISTCALPHTSKAWSSDLVLPCAISHWNICQREYALTVDVIKKPLPSWNEVSLAWDGWTTSNKVATMSVNVYSMDRNWGLPEIQLTRDEVDHLFFSPFECSIRVIGQGPTY